MNRPQHFLSKTVTIEAMQYDGTADSRNTILAWIGQNDGTARVRFPSGAVGSAPTIEIGSLEGPVIASEGWWVIRGTAGEFYPCRDDVFQRKYAPILAAPMREAPALFGSGSDRQLVSVELENDARVALESFLLEHDVEIRQVLAQHGVDWASVQRPVWMRAVSVPELAAALGARS